MKSLNLFFDFSNYFCKSWQQWTTLTWVWLRDDVMGATASVGSNHRAISPELWSVKTILAYQQTCSEKKWQTFLRLSSERFFYSESSGMLDFLHPIFQEIHFANNASSTVAATPVPTLNCHFILISFRYNTKWPIVILN